MMRDITVKIQVNGETFEPRTSVYLDGRFTGIEYNFEFLQDCRAGGYGYSMEAFRDAMREKAIDVTDEEFEVIMNWIK